jgi:hypothetical protein
VQNSILFAEAVLFWLLKNDISPKYFPGLIKIKVKFLIIFRVGIKKVKSNPATMIDIENA